jgi:hypothetical protein
MYSDVENSMHYTGRPKTPIEKAIEHDELSVSEETPLVETENTPEVEAVKIEEEKIIEPNKPVE